jgi:hypothetical protein
MTIRPKVTIDWSDLATKAFREPRFVVFVANHRVLRGLIVVPFEALMGDFSAAVISRVLVLVQTPGSKSTYDSYFSGASCLDRVKSKSGCELY